MKQFKALIKKEYATHKKVLLTPLWVLIGVYVLNLAGIFINWIRTGNINIAAYINFSHANQPNSLIWIICYFATLFIGYIALFSSAGLADSLINDDYRKKCEILHLSQPISLIKIMAAKLYLVIVVSLIITLLLSLLNALILSIALKAMAGSSIGIGLIGAIQGFASFVCSFLFAVTLSWFLATIFKNKGLLYPILILAGIEITTIVLNGVNGWSIPSLVSYLMRLVFGNVTSGTMSLADLAVPIRVVIDSLWSKLLSTDNLMRLIYSLLAVSGSYFIYKRREIR